MIFQVEFAQGSHRHDRNRAMPDQGHEAAQIPKRSDKTQPMENDVSTFFLI